MVEQRGMLNHLHAKVLDLGLTPGDVVAQTASQCFDISVWQFLSRPRRRRAHRHLTAMTSPTTRRRLLNAVAADDITVVETVPSLLRAMMDEVDALNTAKPALAGCAGWCPPARPSLRRSAAAGSSRYPAIPLLNAYGPTECSDDVTHAVLRQAPSALQTPIGTPVANMRLYVLDRTARPCPINVPGELYVAGVGVGRGYLAEPRRTAEVFLPDPFSSVPGARLYRTGDLARFLSDGNTRIPRPRGPPGEGPRLPHRAGGD